MNQSSQLVKQFTDYCHKFAPKASRLFASLLPAKIFAEKTQLHVLVVGAGVFPGYLSLLQQVMKVAPQMREVHFVLVEPMKKMTDIFMQHFAKHAHDCKVDFTIANEDVAEFLKKYQGNKFDLVYFEHPETMTLPVMLAKAGWKSFRRVLTLRKSLPQLAARMQPDALIVASCMSTHELKQLKALLHYGLDLKTQTTRTRNPLHYFFGGPFTVGLQGSANQTLAIAQQEQRVHKIARSDDLLFVAVLLSFVIYLLKLTDATHVIERTFAVLLMGAQLFLHRPGLSGLLIKIILLGLLSVVAFVI